MNKREWLWKMSINTVAPGVQGKPHMLLNVRSAQNDAPITSGCLPEISGNKTSLLRKSVCSDLLTLFNSPLSALPSLLVSGMPEWQVHNQSDKHLQSWYCRQLRSALLFHEPRIAALQVNLKEAYSHTLAISLEIMLYHDDEPLTFDLVWDNGGWRSATLENVS